MPYLMSDTKSSDSTAVRTLPTKNFLSIIEKLPHNSKISLNLCDRFKQISSISLEIDDDHWPSYKLYKDDSNKWINKFIKAS